jgi:hypothetical protein
MGTACHSMWWSLVLAYQPPMRGSCDGRTAGIFAEAAMVPLAVAKGGDVCN